MKFSKLKKLFLLLTLFAVGQGLFAQAGNNSPYSRFGLGKLRSNAINAQTRSMGGIANALPSRDYINMGNPASYGSIDTLTFLFDAGFRMSSVNYKTATIDERASSASLEYLTIGFSIGKWWKTTVGLMPYSDVGYNVIVKETHSEIGRCNTAFVGEGGINKIVLGNGFRVTENLSVGFNVNYLFGSSNTSTILYFPDSIYMLNTKRESIVLFRNLTFDVGAMYATKLKNNLTLNLGIKYSPELKSNIKQEMFIRSMFYGAEGEVEYLVDTILYNPKQKTKMTLPHTIGFGATLQKDTRWLIGLDFNWANWDRFRIENTNDSLQNAWNVAVGGQYTPTHTSISKYWKRITYRAGLRYDQTYLNINGHSINEFGISFGVGLPMPRIQSTFNMGLEVGQGGTTANGLIRETFVNFTVGVSINERWFVKRRYN